MAHVVVFAGGFDFANKGGLRKQFRRLYLAQDLVLDMSAVTFIESSAVAEFIVLIKARWKTGLPPVTVVLQADSIARELFEKTGILNVVKIVETYSTEADGSAPLVIEYVDGRSRIAKIWHDVARRALTAWSGVRSGVAVAPKQIT